MKRIKHSFLFILSLTLLAIACARPVAAPPPATGSPRGSVSAAAAVDFCPALPDPTGPTISVSTEAELREQALNAAAGTTILIEPGTYNLTDVIHIVHNGITLRGSSGERADVILDGGGMLATGRYHVILIEADDVTIADLTIRNGDEHGISVNGSDHPTLYNLHIYDTGYQLVKVNPVGDGSEDGLLACSRLEYTTASPEDYTNGISAHNAHRWVVRDNLWRRIRTPHNVPAPTILFWSGSSDTIVERNTLIDCFQGIAFGNASHGPGDHTGGVVRNNFIYASQPHDSVIEMVYATGWLVAYNTALLLNPTEGLTWSMEARFEGTTGAFAYNLTNLDIWADRDGAAAADTGNITDAQSGWFTLASAGDLHLESVASPAVDTASALPAVPADIDGDARPQGSAPDVGADEYTQSTLPPAGDNQIFLPLVLTSTPEAEPPPLSGELIQPEDLTYLGAFRLPGGDERPQTFAYGGNGMTYNPDHNTLFITGHDRMAYGELPDGSQVAEVSIPAPALAADPADLPQAAFVQDFHDIFGDQFVGLDEIPRIGLQYLNHPLTGPLLHVAWGTHLQSEPSPSHAWFSANLDAPDFQGTWLIGDQEIYSVNSYMFDIPAAWADVYAGGRYLATGRMRDGGQGGMGPSLFAYTPWGADGTPPADGTHLSETTLLRYDSSYYTEEITHSLDGYQHPDEWEGGAWLTTPAGRSAVVFVGTKSTGAKYWYGYINPAGPEYACVDTYVTDFSTCRLADGSTCPPEDFAGCCDEVLGDCASGRGWWSTRWDAQFIFYDPADLARVASGEIESWEPQPYAVLDVDEHLYLTQPEWEILGEGDQRRYRLLDATFDSTRGLLFVLEPFGDGVKPVVHVWRVGQP